MSALDDPSALRDTEALDVHIDDGRGVMWNVGRLTRTQRGAQFQYDTAAPGPRLAVGSRMPWRTSPYEALGVNLHPFFAGLLPEGLRMRALVRDLKTSEDDLFTLLAAVGGDTVGAVAVSSIGAPLPPSAPLVDLATSALDLQRLQDECLGVHGRAPIDSHALAGVQPKVSAGRAMFSVRSADASTGDGILKLQPSDLPNLVANEHYFMTVAREVGLEVARVRRVSDRAGREALLVLRFDRALDRATGRTVRHAQEDACQLLDRYPADKYRVPLRDFAEALELCAAPLPARLALLRLVAFSYLIANGDQHAKNLSVITVRGLTRLAPAYDLLSTLPYGDDRMALKLEGRDTRFRRSHFVAFGERVGVRAAATERMLDTLVERLARRLADRTKPGLDSIGFDTRVTQHLERTITQRCEELDRDG